MTKKPGTGAGGRPTPKVAMPRKRPNFSTGSGDYSGTSGTKSPSGARPVPSVARDTGRPHGGTPPGNRRATRVTPMPTPKKDWGTRGGGKGHGGS